MNQPMTIPWRRSKRRQIFWILAVLLTIVIASGALKIPTGPAAGTSLNGSAVTIPSGNSLRIGTFNIDGGMGTDGAIDLARTARCLQRLDFIGLNEVHGSLFDNQAHVLSGRLNLPFVFAPVEWRWWHASFGNAILTDLPVERWQREVLPNEWFKPHRNYVLTDVDFHGQPVHFLITHTDWKSGGSEQLAIVSNLFLHLPTPAVLMGDLNAPPRDAQIESLLGTTGVEEAINSFLGPQQHRVDWIFLRGLHAVDAGIVDFGASDHPAYWAEVRETK